MPTYMGLFWVVYAAEYNFTESKNSVSSRFLHRQSWWVRLDPTKASRTCHLRCARMPCSAVRDRLHAQEERVGQSDGLTNVLRFALNVRSISVLWLFVPRPCAFSWRLLYIATFADSSNGVHDVTRPFAQFVERSRCSDEAAVVRQSLLVDCVAKVDLGGDCLLIMSPTVQAFDVQQCLIRTLTVER